MGNDKLTISLVTWNGEKYLPYFFDSLKNQTWKDFDLVVLDNGSTDGTNEILSKKQSDGKKIKLILKSNNIGFAAGHNEILGLSKSEYFLVINQDLYLEPNCLQKLVQFMDAHPDCAVAGPKILKWYLDQPGRNSEIDSLGLEMSRSRRVTDRKVLGKSNQVFGVSGALAMYRHSFIRSIGYFFDDSLGAYKEDVDLSYRINSAGGECYIVPEAVAHHARTGSDSGLNADLAQARNKQSQSLLVRYNSYRNHLIMLFKNEYWQNFILDFPWILWYELKKLGFFIFFDRAVLVGLGDIWSRRNILKKQRLDIKKLRKLNWKEMRKKMYA